MSVTPENVHTLPRVDCVVCLSVFHHWCIAFGRDRATEMLEAVFDRTDVVFFFETAQSDAQITAHRQAVPDMGESPEAWLHDFFFRRGAARVETISVNRSRFLVAAYKA